MMTMQSRNGYARLGGCKQKTERGLDQLERGGFKEDDGMQGLGGCTTTAEQHNTTCIAQIYTTTLRMLLA